ncbi:VWA domain-containing protein [Thalassotalea ponticola]|nr:VWA domain-containing protein [Thalassotalea ponticola]MDN3651648.1 VWA domain-containing protein [Thalassotalea ponticola]
MADFHFLRPFWLLAFIALAWLLWQARKLVVSSSTWHKILPPHLAKYLLSAEQQKSVSLVGAAVAGSLIIFALAGPTWQKLPQPVYQVERGSVLIMDMSLSMLATDITPNRLTMARFKAMDLVGKINEGEIGLIAYAGDAFTISPLTADINNINLLLPSLSPEIMPELGSNPLPALLLADEMLNNAGHSEGDIFWFTDGISHGEVDDINEFIADTEHRLNILGVGTLQGAPITLANGELMKDRQGDIVIPKLTQSRLASLARNSGGVYTAFAKDDSDLEKLSSLRKLEAQKSLQTQQQNQGDQWQEFGPYLLLLAMPLLLRYFQKGVLLTPVFSALMVSALLLSPPASASLWDDLWQTKDQQGQQKFNQQQYQQAATTFNDPLWQGSSYYRAEQYEQAAKAFSQGSSADAKYNQGNALAKLGQLQQAIDAYNQALDIDAEHRDAKANKALVESLLKQQNEQQQDGQQQDGQQQDGQQQDGQRQDGQQQDGQQQDGQQQDGQQQDGQQQDGQQQDGQQQNGQQQDGQQQDGQQQGGQQQDGQQQDGQQQDGQQQDGQQQDGQQQDGQKQDGQQQDGQQQDGQQQDGQQQDGQQQDGQQQDAALSAQQRQTNLEQQQKYEQLLRRVTDDPQQLLRNKMRLEYQQRRQHRSSIGVKEQW